MILKLKLFLLLFLLGMDTVYASTLYRDAISNGLYEHMFVE